MPFGILMLAAALATTALSLIFGGHETSDFWVDALQLWWTRVRATLPHVKRLVIYLDNGPKNSGTRTQFLKRMVQFADWSGLEIRLVYDPPYHSKYNRIERCWSSLENKWSGTLLTCWDVVRERAQRMTWKGEHPDISRLDGHYANGIIVPKAEMKTYAARLERLELTHILTMFAGVVRCFSLRGQSKCLFLDGLLAFELDRAHVPERGV